MNYTYLKVQETHGIACALIPSSVPDSVPATIPAPKPAHVNMSRMNVRDGYTNATDNKHTHTLTDDIAINIPLDTDYSKGYKIYVTPVGTTDSRYTFIGYVLVKQNGVKIALDCFGNRHRIEQSKRLREKHVRSAFHIDDRFSVKQICIQMDIQRYKTGPKRMPEHIGAPVARRPKIG